MTLNCTNAILHYKIRLWAFCRGKSDMCKCQLWLEFAQVRYSTAEHVLFRVLQWKIRFVQLSTLNLNCTNAMYHHKTPLFECFATENLISASVNSIVQMRYSIAKYVFWCVLQWKSSFVQVPTLTWKCTYAKILSQNTVFWVLYRGKPDLCNRQVSTLTLNCTNAIFHYKAHPFETFEI